MIEAPALPFRKHGMKRPAPARARQASPAPNGSFDRDYWLGRCEGYRVDGVEGRIGFLDAVRVLRGAAVLAVRAGRLGRRTLLVPAAGGGFLFPRGGRARAL